MRVEGSRVNLVYWVNVWFPPAIATVSKIYLKRSLQIWVVVRT